MKVFHDYSGYYCIYYRDDKIPGVYAIWSVINNTFYIGSSLNIKNRIYNHYYSLNINKHKNKHLQNAWNKYGENCFTWLILEFTSKDNLIEREQYWIDNFNKYLRIYNIQLIADSPIGRKMSEEQKEKLRIFRSGKKHTEESKKKMSVMRSGEKNVMYGKHHTEESKKKISIIQKIKNIGSGNPFYGKKHSEETKEKISKSNKGRSKLSLEDREKIKNLKSQKVKNKEIIKMFNIGKTTLSRIMKGYYDNGNNDI